MFRAFLLGAPLALASLSVPLLPAAAHAQTGNQAQSQSVSRTGEQCQERRERRRRRGRGLGGLIGGIAGGVVGPIGGVGGLVTGFLPVGELLGEAIASMLDCDEQQKAAGATQQVVEQADRGGVGTTASWESTTRPGVRGSSTVTGIETASADGSQCMTVTDIVIVDGEETRAPKRMCRRPPSQRYVRV